MEEQEHYIIIHKIIIRKALLHTQNTLFTTNSVKFTLSCSFFHAFTLKM